MRIYRSKQNIVFIISDKKVKFDLILSLLRTMFSAFFPLTKVSVASFLHEVITNL